MRKMMSALSFNQNQFYSMFYLIYSSLIHFQDAKFIKYHEQLFPISSCRASETLSWEVWVKKIFFNEFLHNMQFPKQNEKFILRSYVSMPKKVLERVVNSTKDRLFMPFNTVIIFR